MRYKVARAFGVLALVLLLCPLGACSGQQQQQEDLEATQEYDEQGYDQETTDDTEEGYDNTETDAGYDDNAGYDENTGYNDTGYDTESTELENPNLSETANTETATENDLAEIIEELNNQATAATDTAVLEETVPAESTVLDPTLAGGFEGTAGAAGGGDYGATPVASAGSAPTEATFPFQPGGTPAGQGLPELGSKMPYIVQKGDTLAVIAQNVYGTTSKWREMADLSGLENPSRIYPGDLVYYTLSEEAIPFAQQYENLPRSEETVQPGDTLITISQRVYGTREGWKSIWRHNGNIDNPDTLAPGSVVYYLNTANLSASVKQARKEFTQQLAAYKAIQAERKAALELAKTEINSAPEAQQIEINDYNTVVCAQMIADATVPVQSEAEGTAKVMKEFARIPRVALI